MADDIVTASDEGDSGGGRVHNFFFSSSVSPGLWTPDSVSPPVEYGLPGLCVACGAPAGPLGQSGEDAVLNAGYSYSVRTGNTIKSQSVRALFPLCSACAGARANERARAQARENGYPNVSWVRSLFVLSAVGFLFLLIFAQSDLRYWLLLAAIIPLVSGALLRDSMRKRFDRENPAEEDHRIALIRRAAWANASSVGFSLGFRNEKFAQAFRIANPNADWQVVSHVCARCGKQLLDREGAVAFNCSKCLKYYCPSCMSGTETASPCCGARVARLGP